MAEILMSPNATATHKQRPTVLSPVSSFFLGSNDDKLERAQARAARAAAIRRKSLAATLASASPPPPPPPPADPCLDKQQILALFQNCIKLASENKINQKNTWELRLIDHLCDIINVEEENEVETNFQKASCTLEAGIKIYSMRVDSVHSEAYKVLGGINRVGQENEQVSKVEGADMNDGQEEDQVKKEKERKLSPLSTLESSFEALNVKKFDVAFAVDPLYHQTSAQFDEGGAKGLLLNNLGVYGSCRVLFDSLEVPGKWSSHTNNHDQAGEIDITFAKECVEQMVLNIPTKNEISPSLRDIVNQFNEDNQRVSDAFSSEQNSADRVYDANDNNQFNADLFENSGTWAFDHEDQATVVDEETYERDPILSSPQQENESYTLFRADGDNRFDKVDDFLILNLGFTSKQNAWAGPEHWKYQKVKDSENLHKENGSPVTNKKSKSKKQAELDIDFTKALENDILDVFTPPKNPKSLLLPANRAPCNTTLPEDCHYHPEDLVKLFLLPNIMCLGRRGRRPRDESGQQRDDFGSLPSWEDEGGFDGQFDDGNVCSDVEDSDTLVSQPRQVNKIEVQYDKTSKQVDVQLLKETLWDHIQESDHSKEETVSFKHVLATFPTDCIAAASLQDISPHLCFICLLHLANEHGLTIHGCSNLDDLTLLLPSCNNSLGSGVV